jgi:hypothetical protein
MHYYLVYLKGNTRYIIPNARFRDYQSAASLAEHYEKHGPYVGEDIVVTSISNFKRNPRLSDGQ